MEDYRHNVYLSGSWDESDRENVLFIAELLAKQGLLVVADDEAFKGGKHGREMSYIDRVQEIMTDCSGFVILFPYKKEKPQTTSPYMFMELLLANKYKIPLLIFVEENVKSKFIFSKKHNNYIARFGKTSSQKKLLSIKELETHGFSDALANDTFALDLDNIKSLNEPIILPQNAEELSQKQKIIKNEISRFCNRLKKLDETSFVFNIIPFSMEEYHKVIAKVVLRETGLPCYLAKDYPYSEGSVRGKSHKYIENATFIISDLSKLRDTCIYETGFAVGNGREIHAIKKGSPRKLPFGLDDLQVYYYKNKDELHKVVTNICRRFKRRIINFELLENPAENPKDETGIPSWYFEKKEFSISLIMVILYLLVGVLFSVAATKLFSLSIGIGIGIAVFGVLVTISKRVQHYLESKIIKLLKSFKFFLYF